MGGWRAWDWDGLTAAWVLWMVAFVVLESVALVRYPGQALTDHLRPLFQTHDLAYFLAVGLWLWIGWHFLVDGLWLDVQRTWPS